MKLFFKDKKEFDLEQHLQNVVGKYYEEFSEEQKNALFERIVGDNGNKKYVKDENHTHRIDEKHGKKIYELNELTNFPDWQSDKDFPRNRAYPIDSKEHKEGVKRIEDLISKFTNNDSAVATDLKNLLENSEIHYRVRNWNTPNGNCSFKSDKPKNQIVICIYDIYKSEYKDGALAQVLAHELGHALDFSQCPKEGRCQYMDGRETTADFIGASLLTNAGMFSTGFSDFMGKDYQDKIEKKEDPRMFYSPDGKYRKENFDIAYDIYKAKRNRFKSAEKENSANKIKELRGLSETRAPYKPKPISKENLQGLRYVPNWNNGGR